MSKEIANENRDPVYDFDVIDAADKIMYDDIDECLTAADEFIRAHPNYYDHSDIPSEPMTNEQFREWLHKKLRARKKIIDVTADLQALYAACKDCGLSAEQIIHAACSSQKVQLTSLRNPVRWCEHMAQCLAILCCKEAGCLREPALASALGLKCTKLRSAVRKARVFLGNRHEDMTCGKIREMQRSVEREAAEGITWTRMGMLLREHPSLAKCVAWDRLNDINWCYLLKENPQYGRYCDWKKLDGVWLGMIFSSQPALAKHADGESWRKLDGLDWARLLSEQPQFAEFCDWTKLSGENWGFLLGHQPQFEEHLDWANLNAWGWCRLLELQPQYADRCAWDKLRESVRLFLLRVQPRVKEYADESKMGMEWAM